MGNKLIISQSGSFSLDSSTSSLQAFYQQPLGRNLRRNSTEIQASPSSPTKRTSSKGPLSAGSTSLNDVVFERSSSPTTNPQDYNILLDESSEPVKKRMNVIMLGTGGSAKTTVLKQFKLLGGKREDLTQSLWQEGIVVPCFDLLIAIFNRKNFYYPNAEYHHEESDEVEQQVFDLFDQKKILNIIHPNNQKLIEEIAEMWNNEPILRKVCTEMLLENQVESVPVEDVNYYFSRAVAVHRGDKPSDKDLLISQRKTTGVTHVEFAFNNGSTLVNIWDCGGQKNERKKWKYMFTESQKLTGKIFVIYFVALSEYNQLCYEDETTNRTHESLKIFESVANNPEYENYPLFLIFTKKDIFKQKLRYTSLSVCFEDCPEDLKANEDTTKIKRDIINNWTGFLEDRQCVSDEIYEKSFDFVKRKFMERISNADRRKQTEKNIKVVNAMDADDVRSNLVEELLEQTMVEEIYKDDLVHYL